MGYLNVLTIPRAALTDVDARLLAETLAALLVHDSHADGSRGDREVSCSGHRIRRSADIHSTQWAVVEASPGHLHTLRTTSGAGVNHAYYNVDVASVSDVRQPRRVPDGWHRAPDGGDHATLKAAVHAGQPNVDSLLAAGVAAPTWPQLPAGDGTWLLQHRQDWSRHLADGDSPELLDGLLVALRQDRWSIPSEPWQVLGLLEGQATVPFAVHGNGVFDLARLPVLGGRVDPDAYLDRLLLPVEATNERYP